VTARVSTGTGNWNTAGTWNPNGVPVAADTLTIQAGHNVSMNAAAGACTSLTVNGTLTVPAALGALALTLEQGITFANAATFVCDLHASYADSFTLTLNNQANGGSPSTNYYGVTFQPNPAGITLRGFQKTRWSQLVGAIAAGAVAATVADATGWQVGDVIVFGPTQAFAAGAGGIKADKKTLTSVNPATGVLGWAGGLTYSHAINGYVGNLSSNVTIQSAKPVPVSSTNDYQSFCTHQFDATSGANIAQVDDVAFWHIGRDFSAASWRVVPNGGQADLLSMYTSISRNAFYNAGGYGLLLGGFQKIGAITDNIAYNDLTQNSFWRQDFNISDAFYEQDYSRFVSFSANQVNNTNGYGFQMIRSSGRFVDCVCSGASGAAVIHNAMAPPPEMLRCKFFANNIVDNGTGDVKYTDSNFGTDFGATNGAVFDHRAPGTLLAKNCNWQAGVPVSSFMTRAFTTPDTMALVIANKNGDPLVNETWTNASGSAPSIERDNANGYAGSGSTGTIALKINTTALARSFKERFQIVAPNGQVATLSGRIKRSGAQTTTVTLSGLGIVPVVYNCVGAPAAWEQFFVSATNNTGADSVFDVTIEVTNGIVGSVYIDALSAPSAVALNAGDMNVWADGVPLSLITANYVSALDVMNVLLSQLTLPGSVGKAIREQFQLQGLDPSAPLVVTNGQRAAGAGISQAITDVAGTVTVTRQ
jgi:hypothetical protein